MARRPLEIAREAFASLPRGDAERTSQLFAPDAEWHNTNVFPGERVWHGPDGILAFWQTLTEDIEDGSSEIEQELEAGDRVAIGIHGRGRGKASGAIIDVHYAAVFELHGEQVSRVQIFGSWQRAIESLERS